MINFVVKGYIDDIEVDSFVFLVMFFVENYCQLIYDCFENKERGRPRLPAKNMLTLVLYSYMMKIYSSSDISSHTKTESTFKLIMEGISVSRTSISRYRNYFLDYYQEILSKTLLFAYNYDLSTFCRVAVDRIIIKACNAPFNYITKKDLRKLLRILKNKKYGVNEVLLLKKPAQKFYYNKNMTIEQKILFLEEAKVQMKLYGRKKIPLYDP